MFLIICILLISIVYDFVICTFTREPVAITVIFLKTVVLQEGPAYASGAHLVAPVFLGVRVSNLILVFNVEWCCLSL